MKAALIAFICLSVLAGSAGATDKGTCPPTPRSWTLTMPDMPESTGDQTYLGTVSLLTVISDKGYFCSARVIHGFDKNLDADAMKQVREWKFEPAKKHGQTIPVVVQIDIQYWQDKDGKVSSVTSNAPKFAKASAPE